MYFTYENNSKIQLNTSTKIGTGGEGNVFAIEGTDQYCVKIYHHGRMRPEMVQKLQAMINKKINHPRICWPKSLVYDNHDNVVGYLMNKAKGREIFSLLRVPSRKLHFPNWNRIHLCRVAIQILGLFSELHKKDILIGDINDKNILVSEKNVYFVDTDSYQFDDFLCPVGSPSFLAPDLQGKALNSVQRTLKHELFAISVLLFKILMIGQAPYNVIDGGSPAENIRNGNFPYPIDNEYDFNTPKGPWLALWASMDPHLKRMFYETFTQNRYSDIIQMTHNVQSYLNDMEKGNRSPEINLQMFLLQIKGSLKIDDGRKKGMGEAKNVLNTKGPVSKFAILELSTRACKLLIADLGKLTRCFSWDAFENDAELTDTGHLLDQNNYLDWHLFQEKVLPTIEKFIAKAKSNNVQVIYCVATAAIRSASNREEVLANIKSKTSINIQILDRIEEAKATMEAYRWSVNNQIFDTTVLIDQGGGSTELSAFGEDFEFLSFDSSTNIPLGTTTAINFLFLNAEHQPLKTCFEDAIKSVRRKVLDATRPLRSQQFHKLIGVGSAITDATGKNGNKRQHNTILTKADLFKKQQQCLDYLTSNQNLETLKDFKDYYNIDTKDKMKVQKNLVSYLGLGMLIHIMERLDIDQITVNGVGLRYGICYQYLKETYPDFYERPDYYRELFKENRTRVGSLIEGDKVYGRIQNINHNFGIFVSLAQNHTGLIHKNVISRFNMDMNDFKKNQLIEVRINKIKLGNPPKFDLEPISQ